LDPENLRRLGAIIRNVCKKAGVVEFDLYGVVQSCSDLVFLSNKVGDVSDFKNVWLEQKEIGMENDAIER
jgi:hypothetical protein